MKYKKKKLYRLFEYEHCCGMIYFKVKDGLIYFYNCHDYWGEKYRETIWIDHGFSDCKLILRSEEFGSGKDFCYLLLKESNGMAYIMEMVSKDIILKDINYDCRLVFKNVEQTTANKTCYMLFKENDGKAYVMEIFTKDIILKDISYQDVKSIKSRTLFPEEWWLIDDEKRKDASLVIWNKKQKQYSVFSVAEGYIFGPYPYIEIEEHASGVILDEHLAVENDGYVFDFADYENDRELFYNKEKDDYRLFLDDEDGMFYTMEKDEYSNDDIVKFEQERNDGTIIYKYNKETGEFNEEFVRDEDGYEYSERDTWWALTDGQYGDYPEEGVDWDRLDDSLGF